jgi:hypothetical protein
MQELHQTLFVVNLGLFFCWEVLNRILMRCVFLCVCAELSAWNLFFVFLKLFSVSVVVADILRPVYFRGEEFVCVCLSVCMFCFVSSFLPGFFIFFNFGFVFFFPSMEGWSIDCLSCFSRGRFYCRCRYEISGCLRWLWSAGYSPDSAIAFISWSVFRLIGALE